MSLRVTRVWWVVRLRLMPPRQQDRQGTLSGGRLCCVEFPTPDDAKNAPAWENYAVAQAAAASLGLIPKYTLALGVDVDGTEITLVIQVPHDAPAEDEDIADIVSELSILLGPRVQVRSRMDRRDQCRLSPHDTTRWFFAARL